jgi:Spy/CpxP family protein refolding chaperone
MRKLTRWMAAVAVLAAATTAVSAQPQGGRRPMSLGPSPLQLLGQKSVQEELKMTDDQTKSVGELSQKQLRGLAGLQDLDPEEREKKFSEMRKEAEKNISEILKPEQAKRLNQIYLQQQGAQAFERPEVVKDLKITDEQKAKIKDMREAAEKEIRSGNRPGGGDRMEVRRRMQEMNRTAGEKIVSTVLTEEQKTKWKEMAGAPFKGEIRIQGGRPGGGGGGGRNP